MNKILFLALQPASSKRARENELKTLKSDIENKESEIKSLKDKLSELEEKQSEESPDLMAQIDKIMQLKGFLNDKEYQDLKEGHKPSNL